MRSWPLYETAPDQLGPGMLFHCSTQLSLGELYAVSPGPFKNLRFEGYIPVVAMRGLFQSLTRDFSQSPTRERGRPFPGPPYAAGTESYLSLLAETGIHTVIPGRCID